nr:hypothetical protein [Tanacetum cinerariifolium]
MKIFKTNSLWFFDLCFNSNAFEQKGYNDSRLRVIQSMICRDLPLHRSSSFEQLKDLQKRDKVCASRLECFLRNIVTNSRVTPSWREIVGLTFSEAGVLHVNWISFGHCVKEFLVELKNDAYYGMFDEDVVDHIAKVLELLDLIKIPGMDSHRVRMKVFPLSLADDARPWTKNGVWKEPTPFKHQSLKDGKLKEEALKNNAIMDGMIDEDDKLSNEGWKRWDDLDNTNHDNEESENETEHEEEERCEVFDDHERPVFFIRRFEMVKYSFKDNEEFVAIKENKYDDLTNTSKVAIHAYQEIFRMMDEG